MSSQRTPSGGFQSQYLPITEKYMLAIARALYSTRLHMLVLTEVVRLKVEPDEEGIMALDPDLEQEMKNQAFDFLLALFPPEFHPVLLEARTSWMTTQ